MRHRDGRDPADGGQPVEHPGLVRRARRRRLQERGVCCRLRHVDFPPDAGEGRKPRGRLRRGANAVRTKFGPLSTHAVAASAGAPAQPRGRVPAGSADAEIDRLSQEKARLEEQELAEASAQRHFPAGCLAP